MRKIVFILFAIAFLGCNHRPSDSEETQAATVFTRQQAGSPYFTNDHLGNVVLCWTGGGPGQELLTYAVYDKQSGTFGEPVAVAPSKGTGMHNESMNKMAFKNDGTIISVFEKKHPTEKNRFAGSIFYSQSFDGGQTWTKENVIHSDTLSDNSRSFFDVALLPDGEVGAVWLDGRLNLGKEGSALFFSKTKDNSGFQTDVQIGETVCQCCRTDICTDPQGNVHILYRDIEPSVKGQIRDFAHIISIDSGKTFSAATTVSDDNWIIDGCPHTGASMAATDKLEVVWFTAGGLPGLYYTSSTDHGKTFRSRELIAENASHPQIASLGNFSAIVLEETESHKQTSNDHHMHSHTGSSGAIVLLLRDSHGKRIRKVVDSEGGEFPVVSFVNREELLVAYTKNGSIIAKKVKL